jgi:phosphatidylserine decarboxylase
MSVRAAITGLLQQDGINFVLTNRIPRRALSIFMGWFSRIEQPLVRDLSLAAWRLFCDLDLAEARKVSFHSLHDCFTRELKPGARPVDPDPATLASPCDGILGACGTIRAGELIQAKDHRYTLADLVADPALAARFEGGSYVTIRICASMYHRFHAPHDARVHGVTYIAGDAFNVNPVALARVPRLFCRNERAVIRTRLTASGAELLLVPVAAVLVASIRLHFADVRLHLRYTGPTRIPCVATVTKGEELGWFEHGSTIIVIAPPGFTLAPGREPGARLRAGEALLRLPEPTVPA